MFKVNGISGSIAVHPASGFSALAGSSAVTGAHCESMTSILSCVRSLRAPNFERVENLSQFALAGHAALAKHVPDTPQFKKMLAEQALHLSHLPQDGEDRRLALLCIGIRSLGVQVGLAGQNLAMPEIVGPRIQDLDPVSRGAMEFLRTYPIVCGKNVRPVFGTEGKAFVKGLEDFVERYPSGRLARLDGKAWITIWKRWQAYVDWSGQPPEQDSRDIGFEVARHLEAQIFLWQFAGFPPSLIETRIHLNSVVDQIFSQGWFLGRVERMSGKSRSKADRALAIRFFKSVTKACLTYEDPDYHREFLDLLPRVREQIRKLGLDARNAAAAMNFAFTVSRSLSYLDKAAASLPEMRRILTQVVDWLNGKSSTLPEGFPVLEQMPPEERAAYATKLKGSIEKILHDAIHNGQLVRYLPKAVASLSKPKPKRAFNISPRVPGSESNPPSGR